MDKQSAKYWALFEIVSEIEGMIENFSSRNGHEKVSTELLNYQELFTERIGRMSQPKYDFRGTKIKG